MSKRWWLVFSLVALVGVTGCDSGSGSADMGQDLGLDAGDGGGGDMGAGAIGDPCKLAADCKEGPTPTCFKSRLFNNTSYLPTPGGYCSSGCQIDDDCGTTGFCVDFGGGDGKWCMKGCDAPSGCRTGYACFFFLGCFPDDNLNCDPQSGDGTCQTFDDKEGGCIRAAVGNGQFGQCRELCNLGTGTCEDSQGEKRHCIVRDEKHRIDGSTPDPTLSGAFIGPICSFIPDGTLKTAGQECLWDDGAGGMTHYTNVCIQGYECDLKGSNPTGQGFSAAGDDTCRELCYLSGGMPSTTIGVPDGGVSVASCAVGTCTDIWGVASATKPHLRVGLCR